MVAANFCSPQLWGRSSPHKTATARSSNILNITLLLATLAQASVTFTNDEYVMRANEPFTITWEGNRGPVDLTLMNGPDIDLQSVMVIATGLSGTKYTWTPPRTLKTDGYEFQIEDGVSVDYSPRFQFPAPPEPTSSTVTTTKPTSTITSTSTSTTYPSSSPTFPPEPAPSLSTGAKAGIAVGATLGGLFLLSLLGWFIYRQGKKATKPSDERDMADGVGAGGYYAPENFDQDTMVGGSSVGGGFSKTTPWGGPTSTTPLAELGQPEYMPRELWAGGPGLPHGQDSEEMIQHQQQQSGQPGYEKGASRAYSVPGVLPGYTTNDDLILMQGDRVADNWHGVVVSPASGLAGVGGFGASPSSETSSPAMGYSATVTTGGPPATPPVGLGEVLFGEGESPLSVSGRLYADRTSGGEIHPVVGNAYGRGAGY